jgi:parallel beta-helix repeat protein
LLYTFEDNTVNDLILGYFNEPKNVKLIKPIYGQIIIVFGTKITIKNQNSDLGFVGITLRECNSVVLEDLKIVNSLEISPKWGIWSYDSERIEINNVVCRNEYGGIILKNTNNSIIKSSLCEGGSAYGIWLQSSHNNRLVNNTCRSNIMAGIRLYDSDFCHLSYNILENNSDSGKVNLGLMLEIGSDFNIIHHNIFISDLADGTPQAVDDCQNNTWYEKNTLEGNYYSDWLGVDSYSINGSAGSVDPYPLSEIPIYIETNYFAIYFSVILLFPIIVTMIIQLRVKRKSTS